jgi:hypothetical protein
VLTWYEYAPCIVDDNRRSWRLRGSKWIIHDFSRMNVYPYIRPAMANSPVTGYQPQINIESQVSGWYSIMWRLEITSERLNYLFNDMYLFQLLSNRLLIPNPRRNIWIQEKRLTRAGVQCRRLVNMVRIRTLAKQPEADYVNS